MNPALHRASLFALVWAALAPVRAAETPAALPPDAPWKIHQISKPIYPPRLIQNGVSHGDARVRVSIDATGQLLDALLLACSHRDFGDEALRVVKTWRFDAGRENGEPIGVVGDITFAFEINGTLAFVNTSPVKDSAMPSPGGPPAYGAERMERLDRIPTQTHVVPPTFPPEWSEHGITGSATVEFYIDETGRARVPIVISADQPLLGASAVAAVMQWRFEPPTRQGRPVLVRAQQVFTFPAPKK